VLQGNPDLVRFVHDIGAAGFFFCACKKKMTYLKPLILMLVGCVVLVLVVTVFRQASENVPRPNVSAAVVARQRRVQLVDPPPFKKIDFLPRTSSGTLIPLVAHFVYGLWDSTPIPEHYQKTIDAWKAQGWQVKVWNRDMVNNLLERYPDIQSTYRKLSRKVQCADLARYVIVFDEGGFYFDCDCEPSAERSLKNYMIYNQYDASSMFFIEHYATKRVMDITVHYPIRKNVREREMRLANFAFGCAANHPALKHIIDVVMARCAENPGKLDDYGILYTTGPDAVTEALHDLIEAKWPENYLMLTNNRQFMQHNETGTWRNSKA